MLNIGDNNDSFIIKKEIPQNFSDTLKTRLEKKSVYEINEKAFEEDKNYINIYTLKTKDNEEASKNAEPHDN